MVLHAMVSQLGLSVGAVVGVGSIGVAVASLAGVVGVGEVAGVELVVVLGLVVDFVPPFGLGFGFGLFIFVVVGAVFVGVVSVADCCQHSN